MALTVPNPVRKVSRSRIVMARLAGTVSSEGDARVRKTRRSPGSAATAQSRHSPHASIRIMAAAAVNGVASDAVRKTALRGTGAGIRNDRAPSVPTRRSWCRLRSATIPGMSPRSTYPDST